MVRALATFFAYLVSLLASGAIHHTITGGGWSTDNEFIPLIVALLVATDKHWDTP